MLEDNQQNTKNVSHSKRKIAVIAAAVLVIALIAGLTTSILMSNQNPSSSQTGTQANPQSWMKVGAYATYEGQTSVIGIDVSFNAKMQIVDQNQTHIQVATDFNMSTPYGATENRTTAWVNRENMTFQQVGMTLNNTYNTEVTLAKLGTRSCTVYEYSNDGISAAYYIDDKVQWPVKMVMTSPTSINGLTYSMNINLVDTNIPSL